MTVASRTVDDSPATVEDALSAQLPRYQPGLDLRGSATGVKYFGENYSRSS